MNTATTAGRARFRRMDEGTREDWEAISAHSAEEAAGLAGRVLDHLRLLDNDGGGFAVSRYEHSLQTATRAWADGRDEEYVVCALLHDIGDTLGSYNHADIAAAILEPFVSEQNHWIVKHHGIFQGYYFFHYLGLDRNLRDRYRDSPHFEACAEFCRYDQAAFDPEYVSKPIEFFEPMVQRLFASPRQSLYLSE